MSKSMKLSDCSNRSTTCGDYKAHQIRVLALRVKSKLDRTRYRLLTRDWSMAQLLIGRSVKSTCIDMHASLVDSPPGRRDARWRGGLWLCVGLPHVNTPWLALCHVLLGLGLSLRQELTEPSVAITLPTFHPVTLVSFYPPQKTDRFTFL